MRLKQMIKKLQKLESELKKKGIKKNPVVIIDYDEDMGWYNAEKIKIIQEGGDYFINLKSSNEA